MSVKIALEVVSAQIARTCEFKVAVLVVKSVVVVSSRVEVVLDVIGTVVIGWLVVVVIIPGGHCGLAYWLNE